MISEESLLAVEGARLPNGFVRPLHESWCFSRIPHTVKALLGREQGVGWEGALPPGAIPPGAEDCTKVVLIVFDGLGWRFLNSGFGESDFVRRGERDGVLAKLTSEFPSTTVVHLTRLATGLGPSETGILEWFYYEPRIDDVVSPFLFNRAGETTRDTLSAAGHSLYDIWPRQSFFSELSTLGISSYLYQTSRFCPSTFTNAVGGTANVVPYANLAEAGSLLGKRLKEKGRAFHMVYFDTFDHVCHTYGASSKEAKAEGAALLEMLHNTLLREVEASGEKVLVVLTADHGEVDTDPARTLYLNRLFPDLPRLMKKNKKGKPILPCGSMGRDFFLHVEEGQATLVRDTLAAALGKKAEVMLAQDLMDLSLFAGTPRADFRQRLGDVVVLPHLGEAAFWWEPGKWEARLLGNHGGLTPQEMEIPWLAFCVG